MLRVWTFAGCLILLINYTYAQVGIGTTNPNSSAMLHVESTTRGVLFPRMTTAQRNAIAPVNGLMVFDTDSNSLFIYQALPLGWKPIKGMSSLKDMVAGNAAGDVLYWNGTDWVLTPLTSLFHFYYRDKDGDGYGDKYLTVMSLSQPDGYVANNSDCNDDNPGTSSVTFYRDADGDGYGNASITANGCTPPAGYVSNPNDCNDNNAAVNPAATEITNGIDDDCDGLIDENNLTDLPDDAFQDINGDGIDGTESAAIFVSANGSDANPGTKNQPKRTINAGIGAAISSSKTQVYVGDGTYNERVSLSNGISIYGGYSSSTWSRNATNMAVIQGSLATGKMVGVEGFNIFSATTVERLWVTTANATGANTSNYGIYLNNCTALSLRYCTVHAGNGANGAAGIVGATGASAPNNAQPGSPGNCDAQNGVGGNGGTDPACARNGGKGGNGGIQGPNNGGGGQPGIGGTAGGGGGSGCDGGAFGNCTGSPGQNGNIGLIGNAGTNGSGGSGGTVAGGYWSGNNGGTGTVGSPGNGGGGGGGGGGQGGALVVDGGGNGGGGGGAGGCGGTGGSGGTAGGGSFGVFIVNSTGVALANCDITSAIGGQGGTGGSGGAGGNGAPGAAGAAQCTGEVGRGGNGGQGGAGGNGGHGGGAAGGVSYAVYRSGTTLTLPGSNILSAGVGGAGGSSSGNAGIAGASGTVF